MLKFFRRSLRHSTSFMLVSAMPTSLSFLFFSFQTLVLFSTHSPLLRLSFYFKLSVTFDRNCLLFALLSDCNGSLDTLFFRGRTRLMSWPGGVRFSFFLQSLVLVLFSPHAFTLFFSQTSGVLSDLSSSTHRSHW